MISPATIFFSSLVFLISLFFTRVIVSAFLTTLIFFFLAILLEIGWNWRRSPAALFFARLGVYILVTALMSLSFYSLIVLLLEFQITENWMWTPGIPRFFNFLALFFLVAAGSLVNWHHHLKDPVFRLFLLIFVISSAFIYREYRQAKLDREYLPKIYQISRNWGIQGCLVEIRGVNFSPVWCPGEVRLNDQKMNIRSWGEELIIAEQGVPSYFGPVRLFVKRKDGIISNSLPYEIGDPADLIKKKNKT
ncbi:MAG: hypothetical protein JW991_04220 [Candidatus Pacebacteria bacterium]|nr:hypothetical protein [Candidatus Paceibacterota bacterium]